MPPFTPTLKWPTSRRTDAAFPRTTSTATLPATRRHTSPTEIGRASSEPSTFRNACKRAAAKMGRRGPGLLLSSLVLPPLLQLLSEDSSPDSSLLLLGSSYDCICLSCCIPFTSIAAK